MNSNVNGKIFPQSQWKNVYLNNKIIHEEIQYVLDRKQYEKVLGNPRVAMLVSLLPKGDGRLAQG